MIKLKTSKSSYPLAITFANDTFVTDDSIVTKVPSENWTRKLFETYMRKARFYTAYSSRFIIQYICVWTRKTLSCYHGVGGLWSARRCRWMHDENSKAFHMLDKWPTLAKLRWKSGNMRFDHARKKNILKIAHASFWAEFVLFHYVRVFVFVSWMGSCHVFPFCRGSERQFYFCTWCG